MSSQMNSNRCYLVMWPDEQDVNTSTATSNVMAGHQQQLSSSSTSGAGSLDSMPQSPPKTLVHINGRGSTSSDEGAAVDAIGSTSSGHQHPVARIPVTRLAYPFVLPREYQDMQSKLEDDPQSIANVKNSQGARFVVAGNDAATTTLLDTNSGTTFVSVSTPSSGSTGSLPATVEQHCDHHANACSKCVLKETENRNLRKRVQALEEQLCRAIGNKRPKIVSAASSSSGMEPTLITLTPPAAVTPATLPIGGSTPSQQKLMRSSTSTSSRPSTRYNNQHHGQQLVKTDSGSSMRLVPIPSNMQHSIDLNYSHQSSSTNNNNTVSNRTSTSTLSHTANNATPTSMRSNTTEKQSFGDQADDRIELVPGTNVFISTSKLQQILSVVKTGKQLARKLMSIYWDRVTLARSTLSASSQHYDQLDPNTVTAIKTFCVLFDSSSRKSEIHSTMIDKCVQARRPRRSSLRQHGGNPTTTTSGASSPGINLGQVAAEGEESHQQIDMGGDLLNTEEGGIHSSASSVTVQRPLSKHREENHPTSDNNSSSQIFRFSSSEIPKQQLGRSNNAFMVPPLVGMTSNIKDNDKRHAPEEGTYFMISEEQVHEKSQESTPITKGSIVGPFTVIDDNNKESYYRESDTYSSGGSHGAGLTTTTTNMQQVQSLTPDYRGDDNPSPLIRAGDSSHDSPTLIIHLPAAVEGNESSPTPQLSSHSYDIDNQHGGRQSEEGHIINTTTEQSNNGNAVPSSYHHEEVSEIVEFSDDDDEDNSGSSDSEMEESDSHYLIHIPPAAAVVSESGQQQQQHYQYVTDTTAPPLPHTMMPHQHHDNHQGSSKPV